MYDIICENMCGITSCNMSDNMSDFYEKCLIRAVKNARYLKSKGFDWSIIDKYNTYIIMKETRYIDINCTHPLFDKLQHQEYCKAMPECYKNYKHDLWSFTYHNIFMDDIIQHFINSNSKVSILDVGSDISCQFRGMIKGNDITCISNYTTIDTKPSQDIHTKLYEEYPDIKNVHTHIESDIFSISNTTHLKENTYDIVIIDIEPHGKEKEVYDIVYPYLKSEHVVIFKCIGFIDLYATSLANKVLRYLKEIGILHSYFGMSYNNYITRDVTVIINKNKTEYKGIILDLSNEKYIKYQYEKNDPIPCTINENEVYEYLLKR